MGVFPTHETSLSVRNFSLKNTLNHVLRLRRGLRTYLTAKWLLFWLKTRYRRPLESVIAVNYFTDTLILRNTRGALTGGSVKLHHLQRKYPNSTNHFSILYLVSSALPPHAPILAAWAKSNGIKIILNQDGVAYSAWTQNYKEINKELTTLISLADLVIFQSNFCQLAAQRFLPAVPASARILPNCADLDEFKPGRPPLPLKKGAPIRLLVSGTHHHRERIVIPLLAMKHLLTLGTCTQLVIAGPMAWHDATSDIDQEIRTLGLHDSVSLLGNFSQQQAPSIYQSADIFLHLKYKDPCPTTVIEAIACGLPVVALNSGGIPELINDDCGVLLHVEDSWETMIYPTAEHVAQAITRIVVDYPNLSRAARIYAEKHFGSTNWVEQHTNEFKNLLKL
tara:strand:- start:662 stop:1843 length:1182 start_codon:yes stop_codon:yes gene_type:complete